MMWVHSTALASITILRSRKRRQLLQWKRKRRGSESQSGLRFFQRPLTTWLRITTSSTLRRVWVAASNLLPRCAMTPFGATADERTFAHFMKLQSLRSLYYLCVFRSYCVLLNVENWNVSPPKVDRYGVTTQDTIVTFFLCRIIVTCSIRLLRTDLWVPCNQAEATIISTKLCTVEVITLAHLFRVTKALNTLKLVLIGTWYLQSVAPHLMQGNRRFVHEKIVS